MSVRTYELGSALSDQTVLMLAPARVWESGRWVFHHTREGTLTYERRESPDNKLGEEKKFHWVLTNIVPNKKA